MQLVPKEIIEYIYSIDRVSIPYHILNLDLDLNLTNTLPDGNDINNFGFEDFWNLYNKKIDKLKCETKRKYLSNKDKEKIRETLPDYLSTITDKQFQKHPATYLNNRSWENEIIKKTITTVDELKQYIDGGKYEEAKQIL